MTLFALLVAPALAAEPASLTLPYVSCASLGEVWTGTSCSGDADANVLANGHNAALVAVAQGEADLGVRPDDSESYYKTVFAMLCDGQLECDPGALTEAALARSFGASGDGEKLVSSLGARLELGVERGAIGEATATLTLDLLDGATSGKLSPGEVAERVDRALADHFEQGDDRTFLLDLAAGLGASGEYWGAAESGDPYGAGSVDATAMAISAAECNRENQHSQRYCRRVSIGVGSKASADYMQALLDVGLARHQAWTGGGTASTREEDVVVGDHLYTLTVDLRAGSVQLWGEDGKLLADRDLVRDLDAVDPTTAAADAVPVWTNDGWLAIRLGDDATGWLPR